MGAGEENLNAREALTTPAAKLVGVNVANFRI
jgi:hypothetical protein